MLGVACTSSDIAGANKCSVTYQTEMTWLLGALKPSQVQKPISKVVSTMTAANTVQLEVTPTTKTRPQTKKEDTPSLSSVMDPLTSETVSTKRSANKHNPTHIGSKPTTQQPLNPK